MVVWFSPSLTVPVWLVGTLDFIGFVGLLVDIGSWGSGLNRLGSVLVGSVPLIGMLSEG